MVKKAPSDSIVMCHVRFAIPKPKFNWKTLIHAWRSIKGEKSKSADTTKKEVKFAEAKVEAVNDAVAETVVDPFCDENNPRVITFQDVCQAAFVIKGGVDVTPCKVCTYLICRRNLKFSLSDIVDFSISCSTVLASIGSIRHANLSEKGIPTIYRQLQRAWSS